MPSTPTLQPSTFLVDGVSAIAVHNGVARIQFMRLNVEGKPEPSLELAVPVPQVRSIMEAFQKAAKA